MKKRSFLLLISSLCSATVTILSLPFTDWVRNYPTHTNRQVPNLTAINKNHFDNRLLFSSLLTIKDGSLYRRKYWKIWTWNIFQSAFPTLLPQQSSKILSFTCLTLVLQIHAVTVAAPDRGYACTRPHAADSINTPPTSVTFLHRENKMPQCANKDKEYDCKLINLHVNNTVFKILYVQLKLLFLSVSAIILLYKPLVLCSTLSHEGTPL